MENQIESGQTAKNLRSGESERVNIVAGLETEQEKGRVLYVYTDNFIVVYRDFPKIYKYFGSWLDTSPEALAQYLEIGLDEAMRHFNIDPPQTFQFVEVKEGGFSVPEGYHTGETKRLLSFKQWEYARFSKVFSKMKRKTGFREPSIYCIAIHEAIGHGVIERGLLTKELSSALPYSLPPELNFLREGIATYTEYTISGVNPHDYLRDAMIETAGEHFSNMSGEWILDDLTDEQIKKRAERKSLGGFSVSGVFRLGGTNLGGERDRAKLNSLFARYSRGASFLKFVIDSYGMEAFKRWARQLKSGNFYGSLEAMSGQSIREIENGWKNEVLGGEFINNPLTSARRLNRWKGTSDQERKQILDLYLKYS